MSMVNRRYVPSRRLALVTVGLFLAGFFLALLTVGPAAAADVTIANETVEVNADTDTVYVDVNNTNSTTTANLTATWYGKLNGTETQLDQLTFDVAASSTELVESDPVNGSKYESVRVLVVLDNSTVPASDVSVELGTFQQVAGGGAAGFNLGGLSSTQIVIIVVVVLGLGMVLTKE